MAIELNKHGTRKNIDEDKFFDKIIPLIIKHAPERNEFKISDLENKLDLNKDELSFLDEKTSKIRKDLTDNGYVFLNGSIMTLTDKGRDKKHGTEPHNRISKYQKIHIGLTIISLAFVFIFGYLNYSLNRDKSALTNQNNLLSNENDQLKTDFAHYKDSINEYIKIIRPEIKESLNDPSQTKN